MEGIINWIVENFNAILTTVGIAGGAGLLGLVLKKFLPESRFDSWGDKAEKFGAFCGRWSTLKISTWPYIGTLWNKVLEPYFVLLLNMPARFLKGYVGRNGLLSDNPK